MKTAIVGAGFAGVALTYFLSQKGDQITLFDKGGIGGGASGIAPGLVHPYPGKFPSRQKSILENFEKTLELIEVASKTLGHSCIRSKGIIRLSQSPPQAAQFAKCAKRNLDVEAVEGGILLKEGVTLDTKRYLEGLFLASGATFKKEKVDHLLPSYDRIIYATGADLPLPIKRIKGQVLVLKGKAHLPYSLIGAKYLVQEGIRFILGATFEDPFDSPLPSLALAKESLLPHLKTLCPALIGAEVVEVRAGIRASFPEDIGGKVIKLDSKTYAIGGLGSKGLLHHASLAKKWVEKWGL